METTAIVRIKPDVDEAVIALYQEACSLQQYAEARTIASDGDVKVATDDLSLIIKLKKSIEEKRRDYVSPLNDHLKAVNGYFKNFTDPLSRADLITREKILNYRKEQARIRQEQEHINQLRMEAAKAEMELQGELTESVGIVEVTPEQPHHYRTDMGISSTTKVWRFEIVEFSLLPDQYKQADMVKIRKVITAGVAIPGVKAWQEESLRVTTK